MMERDEFRVTTRPSSCERVHERHEKKGEKKREKKALAYVFFFLCELTPRQRAREAQKLV